VKAPSSWTLQTVMSVAQATLARLERDGALDTDEAALMEALRAEVPDVDVVLVRLLRALGEANANEDAVGERMKALRAREDRYGRQAQEYRAAINAILDALGWTKWRHAEFSVSVTAGRPRVHVINALALPAKYVRVTRSPNIGAINADMDQGVVVPGAEWTNGAPKLTIRSK